MHMRHLILRSATYHWRTNLAVGARRRRRGVGARRRAAGRRLGARQPARSGAVAARPDWSGRLVDGLLQGGARGGSDRQRRGRGAADCHARVHHPRGLAPAGIERARLRRRRAVLAVSRARAARRRVRVAGARGRARRRAWRRPADAAAEAVGDSARVAVRTQGGSRTHDPADRHRLASAGRSSASSRFNRSSRKFAPCSRRCHGCSAILRSAGRSTPCWSPATSPRPTRRGRSDPA